MSVSILGGDITVYFDNDTGGDKQIRWTGSAAYTSTRSVNEVYTALQDLFDNNTSSVGDYMQYGTPMKAVTPRVYQIGRLENNDETPWFIDQETIQHLTGGSIQTVGWTQAGIYAGIVRVPVSSLGTVVIGDIGNAVTGQGGNSGVLLDVEDGDVGQALWVRPDDTTDTWQSTGTVTVNGHTATQSAVATTGNKLWNNFLTIGSIESTSTIVIFRDGQQLTSNYWGLGAFDRLILNNWHGTIYEDFLFLLRTQGNTYDFFGVQEPTEGLNVVPLAELNDLNNNTVTTSGASVSFGGTSLFTADIDQDSTNEEYSIQINCQSNPLSTVYRYLQYILEYTQTSNLTHTVQGNEYYGVSYRINHTAALTATGQTVNFYNSTPTLIGTATALAKGTNYIMITEYINQGAPITSAVSVDMGSTSVSIDSIETVAPNKQAPFGTFAGGRFFGARGVYLTSVSGADINNYELTDNAGNLKTAPIQVSFELTGLQDGTEIRVYNSTNNAVIAGVENMTAGVDVGSTGTSGVTVGGTTNNNTFTYLYTYTTDIPIFVVILSLGYQYLKLPNLSLTASNQSIPVTQILDRNYNDPV